MKLEIIPYPGIINGKKQLPVAETMDNIQMRKPERAPKWCGCGKYDKQSNTQNSSFVISSLEGFPELFSPAEMGNERVVRFLIIFLFASFNPSERYVNRRRQRHHPSHVSALKAEGYYSRIQMKNQTPTLFLHDDDDDDGDERAKGLICGVVREKIDSTEPKPKKPPRPGDAHTCKPRYLRTHQKS